MRKLVPALMAGRRVESTRAGFVEGAEEGRVDAVPVGGSDSRRG